MHLVEGGQLVDVREGELCVGGVVKAPMGGAGEEGGPPVCHRVVPIPSETSQQLVRARDGCQRWENLRQLAACGGAVDGVEGGLQEGVSEGSYNLSHRLQGGWR